MSNDSLRSRNSSISSGVNAACSTRGRVRISGAAADTQALTARWSGWPVTPSGPKVRIVCAPMSSAISDQARHHRTGVDVGAAAVGQVEPDVLLDPEDRGRRLELAGAQRGEGASLLVARVGIGRLAARGGDADDPFAAVAQGGQQGAGEVGLVVGVGPDGQGRTEVGGRQLVCGHRISVPHRRRRVS